MNNRTFTIIRLRFSKSLKIAIEHLHKCFKGLYVLHSFQALLTQVFKYEKVEKLDLILKREKAKKKFLLMLDTNSIPQQHYQTLFYHFTKLKDFASL